MTIRSRLLILVLSVLLPAGAAALWLIVQTYIVERQANERTLRDTSRALALVVGRELDQRAAIARVLALSSSLDAAPSVSADSLLRFEQHASRAMEGLGGWVELIGPDGVLLGRGGHEGALAGVAPAATLQQLVDVPMVMPMAPALTGGDMRAAVVQPLQRGGSTRLNVAVTLLPAQLQRIIDQQGLPPEWVATVLDNRGTVVARHPGGSSYAGRSATPDLKQLLAAAREGPFHSRTLDGVEVVGYFSTSPQGWIYLTAMPVRGLVNVPGAVIQAASLSFALLGLTVAGALWVARRISGPVHSLKQAAADLHAGRPLFLEPTGMVECDEVAVTLTNAASTLRAANAELQSQVQAAVERTRMAEQRVSHSQRIEALGRLTGGVAHDFNNLLGVISNSAHVIARQSLGRPELKLPVAATLRAVEVGSRMTQHLLRVAGRQAVHPQSVDLSCYLPDAEELLLTVLGKRVRLVVAVAPATRPVTVDPNELELALINLALNARDAIGGAGQVWLHARDAAALDVQGLAAGDYVLLTFTDDGAGIEEQLAARAFEPFFTTKPFGQGTGLGLSQVHGFCTQAGGTARLASTLGLGTTVSLLLPATSGSAQHPAPAALGDALPLPAAGLRVLLVEDDEALADATAALLNSLNCHVQRARSADEALLLIAGGAQLDIVLSDVVMPGAMDGCELGRQIRRRWPALPVVLITGYSTERDALDGFVVLDKPCTPQALIAALSGASRDGPC